MKKFALYLTLLLGLVLVVSSPAMANNRDSACSDKSNGDACSYQNNDGFCERGPGGDLFCSGDVNGWKDCFGSSENGDKCEQNGEVGACKIESGTRGDRTSVTCEIGATPGGGATCGGATCNSGEEVCDEDVDGDPVCKPDLTDSSGNCGSDTCQSDEICSEDVDGDPVCKPDQSTPGPGGGGSGTPSGDPNPQSISFQNPISANSIPELISDVINAALGILGAITVVVLVISGFKYMTSSNPGEVAQATQGITNAIVGLIIIVGSFLITDFIISALLS